MEQVLEYIKRAHQGDKAARDLLVQNNLGLVWSIVRRFSNRGYDPEDLFQVGSIGLLKAIDRFDTDYEVKFSTYAVPLIIGEIRRYLRDDGMLKVSRTLKEAAWKVSQAVTEWQNEYGRDPTLRNFPGKPECHLRRSCSRWKPIQMWIPFTDRFPEMRERRSHLANRSGIRKI